MDWRSVVVSRRLSRPFSVANKKTKQDCLWLQLQVRVTMEIREQLEKFTELRVISVDQIRLN